MSSAAGPPARRTQAERKEESSRRLLEAAVALIGEQGWERTTAAEIGERAGYSRNMVRDRYGSKDALLEAIQREYEQRLITTADPGGSGLEQVIAAAARVREMVERDPAYLRAILVVSFEAAGPLAAMRPVLRDWVATLNAVVAAWLEQGRDDGSVRADVQPRHDAERLIAQAIGLAYRWVLEGDDATFLRLLERTVEAERRVLGA